MIREAVRLMETHEELIYQMKLERLRTKLAKGKQDIAQGGYRALGREDIGPFLRRLETEADGLICLSAAPPYRAPDFSHPLRLHCTLPRPISARRFCEGCRTLL